MKILVVNASGIGDFFELIRWLYFIKRQKPNYTVDLIVSDRTYDYAKRCPYVRKVFYFNSRNENISFSLHNLKTIFTIKKENYDLIINTFPTCSLTGDIKMFLFIMFVSNFLKTKTIGVKRRKHLSIYSSRVVLWGEENHYSKYEEIFNKIGVFYESIDHSLVIWYDETLFFEKHSRFLDKEFVFFNPFSNSDRKMFKESLWVNVMNMLMSKENKRIYVSILIDEKYMKNILNNVSYRDRIIVFDKTSFDDWIYLIKKSLYVLTVDSATVHIASYFNKKTFVFVPESFKYTSSKPYLSKNIYYIAIKNENPQGFFDIMAKEIWQDV